MGHLLAGRVETGSAHVLVQGSCHSYTIRQVLDFEERCLGRRLCYLGKACNVGMIFILQQNNVCSVTECQDRPVWVLQITNCSRVLLCRSS